MVYDDLGIFLSFIAYPFSKDGKDLFKGIFQPYFYEHKKQISIYDPDAQSKDDPYPSVYTPAGYRMFGSNGLAILSLVDDYSFYNRFFNKNHIQSLLQSAKIATTNYGEGKEKNIDLNFSSVVISGVIEYENTRDDLIHVAQKTFLLPKEKRYRYIGIIRLKIDYRLLLGTNHAITTVRNIKKAIQRLYDCQKKKKGFTRCKYFTIDCYDNDELTVIAFSDKLLTLYNFLGNIRSLMTADIGQTDTYGENKHVFGLTYLSFGYDLERGIGRDLSGNNIICTIETKPGHRDTFYSILLGKYHCDESDQINKLKIIDKKIIISGGCNILFSMPLKNISILEDICKKTGSCFQRDVRNVKVSLEDKWPLSEEATDRIREIRYIDGNGHPELNDEEVFITRDTFSRIKKLMKEVGVSKMVRERFLALLELYNLSCQNILQSFYLKELKAVLENFETMIEDMRSNSEEDLNAIEKMLNSEITNLENACYDRLHIQKGNRFPLEYCGGIQQYLTSFDFAYKQIYKILSPNDNGAFYITISGAERASSRRLLFNLNIHDIIYPELFIVSVWKEIANFTVKTRQDNNYYGRGLSPEVNWGILNDKLGILNTWYEFISRNDSFQIVNAKIHQSEKLLHDDNVTRIIKKIVSPTLIEYYIKDYIVYYFAFGENFSLLWHFYFKILLQTTNCYDSLNHIDKRSLIYMMLRIFMIAQLADDSRLNDFIDKQASVPYDHIIGGQWSECYSKTLAATKVIFDVLKIYGFQEMVDATIKSYDCNIFNKEHPEKFYEPNRDEKDMIVERNDVTIEMMDSITKGIPIEWDKDTSDYNSRYTFLICLLRAYLYSVYLIDYNGTTYSGRPIKSIPRDKCGVINCIMEDNDVYRKMIQIPIDTTGGFFIPSYTIRKHYFRLRTALYKSLWNYRLMFGNID